MACFDRKGIHVRVLQSLPSSDELLADVRVVLELLHDWESSA